MIKEKQKASVTEHADLRWSWDLRVIQLASEGTGKTAGQWAPQGQGRRVGLLSLWAVTETLKKNIARGRAAWCGDPRPPRVAVTVLRGETAFTEATDFKTGGFFKLLITESGDP